MEPTSSSPLRFAWVRKRDGRLVPFEADKISRALFAASESVGRPDAFHGADTLAFCVLPERSLDTLIGGSDFGFQFDQLFVERMKQVSGRDRESVPIVFQQRGKMAAQLSDMLRKNNPVLPQQSANLIH